MLPPLARSSTDLVALAELSAPRLQSPWVMTVLEFIIYLVIAGICGAIARALAGGTPGGFIISVLLGFLGAFIGTWLARELRLPELVIIAVGGHPFPIVWSIIGGLILAAVAHALTRPRYYVT